jgi:hypothetical protein
MVFGQAIRRRSLLSFGLTGATAWAITRRPHTTMAFRFATASCEIEMSVEFFDRYSASGLRFSESLARRKFCLSRDGDANHDCLPNFSGSLAVAHYALRAKSELPESLAIREFVRTIDTDSGVPVRPAFERTIRFEHGVASDIQAFGLANTAPPSPRDGWCILRQDLFLSTQGQPFLIVHWKHALSAIRLLDVIPGEGTREV